MLSLPGQSCHQTTQTVYLRLQKLVFHFVVDELLVDELETGALSLTHDAFVGVRIAKLGDPLIVVLVAVVVADDSSVGTVNILHEANVVGCTTNVFTPDDEVCTLRTEVTVVADELLGVADVVLHIRVTHICESCN